MLQRLLGMATIPALVLCVSAFGCGDDESQPGNNPSGTSSGGSGGAGGAGAMGGAGATGGAGASGGAGGGGAGGYAVIECANTLSGPLGTCTVDQAGPNGVLLGGHVLGPDTEYKNGYVHYDAAGVITCVGCDCDTAPSAANASVVSCPETAISPGLINSHEHITFSNNAPVGHGKERFEHRHNWRTGSGNHTEVDYNSGASTAVVQFAELRFVMSGVTAGVTAGGRNGLLRNLDSGGQNGGLPIRVVESDTFPLDDANGTMQLSGCDYGNNPTTSSDIQQYDGYLPHISEGINTEAHNEFSCTSTGSTDLIQPQTAVVHGVGLRAQDAATMRTDRSLLVWSPRSNVDLYGNTAPVTLMDAMGVPIALGTDWVVSGSMNLLRELACADELNQKYFDKHFDDVALWRMVTTNSAIACGAEHAIGMLKPGLVADIAIFDASMRFDHRAVIGAEPDDVVLVLRGGEVLYGDADVVGSTAFGGAACEPLDVCGRSKRACVAQDLGGGASLASVRAAGEAFYSLFECATPPNEPSCVPYRAEYELGITAVDGDGDGIADGMDLCPTVFDPVRPMDGGQSADSDGDGVGDACDVCPLVMNDSCTPPDANDLDGDGIPNGTDNCLDDANPGQADADEDGHGDDCDACPMTANPGPAPCPAVVYTIPSLRDPSNPTHPGVGAMVSIAGAYVTAVRPNTGGSRGFYVQDTSLAPFSGLFVFTQATPPGVVVGNRVSVSGVLDEFNGLTEITGPMITVEDAGTTLPFSPVSVTAASIATGGALAESHESMLVTVGGVTITVQNADDPQDFDEFTVTGGLRVDDLLFPELDNTCPVSTAFSALNGIVGFSFSDNKLMPRDAADIGVVGCQPYP